MKLLRFINRINVGFSNMYALNTLYTSLVHPVLEYTSIVPGRPNPVALLSKVTHLGVGDTEITHFI